MKRNNKKGFTLVELVIVIAVIAILIAVLVPTFASVISKANRSADEQEAMNLRTAIVTELPAEITVGDATVTVSTFDELLSNLGVTAEAANVNTILSGLDEAILTNSLKNGGSVTVTVGQDSGDNGAYYLTYTSGRDNTVKIYANNIVVTK